MPTDETGKKWACVSCVRGHRASSCDHFDRWMVAVRKTGRPLKHCSHPDKTTCDCAGPRMILMVAIPSSTPCSCKNKSSGNHECLRGSTFHCARVKNVNETPDVDPKILQDRAVASDYNQMLVANSRQNIVAPESSCQCHSKPSPAQFHPAPAAPSNDGSFSPASVYSHTGFDDAYSTGPSNVPHDGNPLIPPFGAHASSHLALHSHRREAEDLASCTGPLPMYQGMATRQNPMTEHQYQSLISADPRWTSRGRCQCGDCMCTGCNQHPFNSAMSDAVANVAQSRPHEMALLAHDGTRSPTEHFSDGLRIPMNGHLARSTALQTYNGEAAFAQAPTMQPIIARQDIATQQGFNSMSPFPVEAYSVRLRMDTSNYNFYQYGNAFPDDVHNDGDEGSA